MALRRAHHACLELADQPPSKTGGLTSKQTPPNPQQYTWMEHVPPKLTQERIDELTKRFAEHYPGEILTSDSMPSIRLLSLVHEGLKTRLTWVPWQYRLSAKQYQEIHEAKSHKPLRSEMQILTHAIVDDTPELSLDHRSLSPGWFPSLPNGFSQRPCPVQRRTSRQPLALRRPCGGIRPRPTRLRAEGSPPKRSSPQIASSGKPSRTSSPRSGLSTTPSTR